MRRSYLDMEMGLSEEKNLSLVQKYSRSSSKRVEMDSEKSQWRDVSLMSLRRCGTMDISVEPIHYV
jgi:recombinational DNA repair ATPase RecF